MSKSPPGNRGVVLTDQELQGEADALQDGLMRDFMVQRPVRVIFHAASGSTQALREVQRYERIVVIGSHRALNMSVSRSIITGLGAKLVDTLNEVIEHVPETLVEAAAVRISPHRPDCLLVIGGGSAIGLAKGLVGYMEEKTGPSSCPSIVCLPTTYSGSEMTGLHGVSRMEPDGTVVKRGGRNERVRPRVVIYDSTLLRSLPLRQAVPSIFNALAHSFEVLWARGCGPLSRMAATESILVAFDNLPRLRTDPDDAEAVDALLYCAHLAAQALDHEEMALQHRLAHVLGGSFHLPHAPTHMAILPHVVAYNRAFLPEDLSQRLGVGDVASALFDLMTDLLGEPPSLASLGFRPDDVDAAVDGVMRACTNNPVPLEKGRLAAMLGRACHGDRPLAEPTSAPLPAPPTVLPRLPLPPPRVPYLSYAQFLAQSPEAAAEVLERRKGRLLNLDRVLMHSPNVAQGWNGMFGALRSGLGLDGRLRELVILRVAVLNRAYYEYFQHHSVFLQEGGTEEEALALGHWRSAECLGDRDKALLAYVDEMTRGVQVSQATYDRARGVLDSDQQMVELTALCAGYNMVSRFLEALALTPETEDNLPPMPR